MNFFSNGISVTGNSFGNRKKPVKSRAVTEVTLFFISSAGVSEKNIYRESR